MRDDASIFVVHTREASPNLDLIAGSLGSPAVVIDLDDKVLERPKPKRRRAAIVDRFEATPVPLVRAWLFAQHVLSRTSEGDTVLVGDRGGLGGILALGEASKPIERRRIVLTVAGDGLFMSTMLIAGTVDHLESPEAETVDWELVQYRYSAKVLSPCQFVVDELKLLGIESHVAVEPEPLPSPPSKDGTVGDRHGWVAGAVSRRNRSGEVFRALASASSITISVPSDDVPDAVWSGTTWDAVSGIRRTMGDRLQRVDRAPLSPAFVILGDPLSPPSREVAELRDSGVPILAARGSVAKALWPEVSEWEDSDELATLLDDPTREPASTTQNPTPPDVASNRSRRRPDRGQKVSVGIPVFGGTTFLSECVESVLAQTQPPHEILLIDDGSRSDEVDAEFERWARSEPDLVRTFAQPNRGVCVARNRLIKEMTGDSFLLLDQDDVLAPTLLEQTTTMLQQDEALWAVASWTEFFGAYEGIEAKPPFGRRVGLRENPIISTGAVVDIVVRERGIEFAPDLAFLFCEDWHFWSQIVAAGGEIGLIAEPLIRHRVHLASGGFQRTELASRIGKARATEPLIKPGTPNRP